jgi:hypothetical protein
MTWDYVIPVLVTTLVVLGLILLARGGLRT